MSLSPLHPGECLYLSCCYEEFSLVGGCMGVRWSTEIMLAASVKAGSDSGADNVLYAPLVPDVVEGCTLTQHGPHETGDKKMA